MDKTRYVRSMFDEIAGRYHLVNRVITLGLDQGWRRRAIARLGLPPGDVVVDLGCGTGELLQEAEKAGLIGYGVDLSFAMLTASDATVVDRIEADASSLPLRSESVDGVVSGFALRNFTDQRSVLREAARILRPGGRLAILEVDQPDGRMLRTGHALWFNVVVPRIGALLSVAAAYRYLPKSVIYLPTPEALRTMLEDTGFRGVERVRLHRGLAQIVTATRAEQ